MSLHYICRNLAFLIRIGIKSVVGILKSEAHVHYSFRKYPRYCHLYMIGILSHRKHKERIGECINESDDPEDERKVDSCIS